MTFHHHHGFTGFHHHHHHHHHHHKNQILLPPLFLFARSNCDDPTDLDAAGDSVRYRAKMAEAREEALKHKEMKRLQKAAKAQEKEERKTREAAAKLQQKQRKREEKRLKKAEEAEWKRKAKEARRRGGSFSTISTVTARTLTAETGVKDVDQLAASVHVLDLNDTKKPF